MSVARIGAKKDMDYNRSAYDAQAEPRKVGEKALEMLQVNLIYDPNYLLNASSPFSTVMIRFLRHIYMYPAPNEPKFTADDVDKVRARTFEYGKSATVELGDYIMNDHASQKRSDSNVKTALEQVLDAKAGFFGLTYAWRGGLKRK